MDEKLRKLRIIEKTDEDVQETVQPKPKFAHPNQSNPIYKNLATFNNPKIGDKWSIEDLLR